MNFVSRLAKAAVAWILLAGAPRSFRHPDSYAKMAASVIDPLSKATGVPPTTFVKINSATQLVGGALFAFTCHERLASVCLIGTMIPTTVGGHPFWKFDDPDQRRLQLIQFKKNVAIIGFFALIALARRNRD